MASGAVPQPAAVPDWCWKADSFPAFVGSVWPVPLGQGRARKSICGRGQIITGAGVGAGIELYLHLLRREHSAAVANTVALELHVTLDHANGDDRDPTTSTPPADGDTQLVALLEWANANLHRNVRVEELASRALMSPRTFTRHFKAATGSSPHAWLLNHRLALAEHLLASTSMSVEEVAHRVGYRGAAMLREQFHKRRGISPRAYRKRAKAADRKSSRGSGASMADAAHGAN